MDLIKSLKSAKNLNDYISISQELNNKYKNAKISVNMSTVLSLKNIRSLEIEYFNKCHDSGAAFNIFGRMLLLPPSKTWSLLGKELVSLLQYWLDAVRKHLISHHPQWWSFLKSLLRFIMDLSKKEHTLNNTLVQELSDSLLDLATRGRTNVLQRHEILHTLNQYCADSGREIRLALRMEFDHYFVRLATMMASCGHVPTQYSTLETLLRWLLPRRDPCLRQEAATRWFPQHLYSNDVRQVFLERPWMNFFQDARDLLNAHNQNGSHVTSVICRKLSIGEATIVSGTEKRLTWLDLNCGSGSLSILLDPKALDAINVTEYSACEAILISNDNIRTAKLYRESVQLMLSITTLEPPMLFPSCVSALDSCDVTAMLSSRTPITAIDAALRRIFQDKYQVLMDLEDEITPSPEKFANYHDEDTRFSHPAREIGRRGRSGYTAWSRNAASWKSPSTASSTSLAQLHDKLAALPHYRFDKEPVSVCAQPKLSRLTELSESDDKHSFDNTNSTLKLGQYGVYHRSCFKKSQSDNEARILKNVSRSNDREVDEELIEKRKSISDSEEVRKTKNYTELEDTRNVSLLLVATVGSADESVINDTLERLSNNKDYSSHNIVDLLVQEALQAKAAQNEKKGLDSGINTGEESKKTQDIVNTIENTPNAENSKSLIGENQDKYAVISKSTSTDESNTEAINDTPMCYVNVRKKKIQRTDSVDKKLPIISENTHEVQAVEDFFSQHFCESNRGELIISPTLARKINETSSESSEFDDCLHKDKEVNINIDQYEIPDKDIIECLNRMVEKVCHDFDKYLKQENSNKVQKTPLIDIGNTEDPSKDQLHDKNSESTKGGIKLKYNLKTTNKKNKCSKKKPPNKNKLKLEPAYMSSEVFNKDIPKEAQKSPEKNTSPENKDFKRRLPRKKRKLYSPKDDNIITSATEHTEVVINVPLKKDNEEGKESDNENIPVSELKKRVNVTPKSTATSYKDIEKDRKKIKKTRAKKMASPISPKTRKLNEVFDHLKENIDSNEKITVADNKEFNKDMAIFNFTSDSEDEDFKKKKVDIQKRISTTTIDSGNSVISRRGRTRTKVDYKENEKGSSDEIVKPAARKRGKRQNTKITVSKSPKVVKIDRPTDLVDEKMRATTIPKENALDSSLVVEKLTHETIVQDPTIQIPEIELVTDDEINVGDICHAIEENKRSKKIEEATKKEKVTKTYDLKVGKEKDDDGTLSPLPGLLVEKVTSQQPYYEDSLTSNFVQKVKKMYKTGGDIINDTNTTQNLLSDNEKTNHSLQMNITEEFNKIQDNDEENADISVRAPNEITLEKTNYSEISPIKMFEFNNENKEYMSDNKSLASLTSKRKKRKLRLKSSETANQSDSDMKYSLRSFKITTKTTKSEVKRRPLKQTDNSSVNLQNINTQTEIICIDDRSQTKVDKHNEIIEISEDVNSEKSIATDGITAHGDLAEEPPSQKSLEQPLQHRTMVDMDESVLDYYTKLRQEIDDSNNSNSNVTVESLKRNEAEPKNTIPSPVLSVKRMTSGDIRKQRSTVSKKHEDYDYRRWLPSQKDSDSDQNSKCTEKSLCVSVSRLSSKVIDNWLNKSKSIDSRNKSRDNYSENANMSPILKKSCLNKTISNPNKRSSIISPIKLWDGIDFTKQYPPSEIDKEKPLNETSSKAVSESEKPSTPRARRYLLRKYDNDVSSPTSNLSTSTRIDVSKIKPSSVKRSIPKNEDADVKKRKVEANVVLTESGPSLSSVEDWLMKIEHTKVGLVDTSIDDTMQNVMEKLDTTVNEIHQNTSKKFVHLFVDAQKHLADLKAQQHQMRQQAATNILTRVAQIIDEEFSELDRRSQNIQENFMETLKQQAIEFIKEDRKQKRDMILLLREDVQSTLDLVKKTHK